MHLICCATVSLGRLSRRCKSYKLGNRVVLQKCTFSWEVCHCRRSRSINGDDAASQNVAATCSAA